MCIGFVFCTVLGDPPWSDFVIDDSSFSLLEGLTVFASDWNGEFGGNLTNLSLIS